MSERTKERLNESKYKKVINLTTGEIFNSIKKAEEFYNIKSSSHISRVCKGKQKTAYGYRWAYHNEV